MNRAIAIIASCIALTAFAQGKDGHKHGEEHKPKYGGIVKEVKEIQYELVAKPDVITVYIEDHGKKVDTRGATGKVSLRHGSDRSEGTLAPAGDNKLEAKGKFNVAPGTTAILVVKRAGQAEETVRFTLK
jgi:hypothetical protein